MRTSNAPPRSTLARLLAGCALAGLVAVVTVVTGGCHREMRDQPRYEALESSDFFDDGQASRTPVDGTVARGQLRDDPHLYAGLNAEGKLARTLPFEVTRAVLERGRERFDIFCSPCHGRAGNGQGMVVQRGFKQPSSFHIERLRRAEVGYFFDVMTNGFGEMSSYATMVKPEDRWAIAAYLRALQLSQHAEFDELPPDVRQAFRRYLEDAERKTDAEHGEHGEHGTQNTTETHDR